MNDATRTCRPHGSRVSRHAVVVAAAAAGTVVSSSEPALADTRQMQSLARVAAAQDGAVIINAFHGRVVGRPSNIRAANS